MDRLRTEIQRFRDWAATIPGDRQFAEWECDYDGWTQLREAFERFVAAPDSLAWAQAMIDELLYILARDNEMEWLAGLVGQDESLTLLLAEQALSGHEPDAKWQLAVQLGRHPSAESERLLEALAQDDHEYVSRRALMALAEQGSSKTEYYCRRAWDGQAHGEMQEYQRIAALHALMAVSSPRLSHYLELARQDGRKYLVHNALMIEQKISQGPTIK